MMFRDLLIFSMLFEIIYSNEFVDRRLEIPDCGTGSIAGSTEITEDIKCAGVSTKEFKLTTKSEIEFNSVTFTEKPSDMKGGFCSKVDSSDLKIKLGTNLQSVIYKKASNVRAILVGDSEEACATSVLASEDELKTGKLIVKSIKCIKNDKLPDLITGSVSASSPKLYHKLGNHICFLAPMLTKPLMTIALDGSKKIELTISSYPIEDCPICPQTKPEVNATNVTTTTTAASSTGMIVGIVLAILIVVLGGIGFVMMKK